MAKITNNHNGRLEIVANGKGFTIQPGESTEELDAADIDAVRGHDVTKAWLSSGIISIDGGSAKETKAERAAREKAEKEAAEFAALEAEEAEKNKNKGGGLPGLPAA